MVGRNAWIPDLRVRSHGIDMAMPDNGKAFFKGSVGCLVLFVVIALLAVMLGGSAHLDAGGFILLIVIGGVIGLIVNAVYQKGRRDGGGG